MLSALCFPNAHIGDYFPTSVLLSNDLDSVVPNLSEILMCSPPPPARCVPFADGRLLPDRVQEIEEPYGPVWCWQPTLAHKSQSLEPFMRTVALFLQPKTWCSHNPSLIWFTGLRTTDFIAASVVDYPQGAKENGCGDEVCRFERSVSWMKDV